MKNTSNDSYLRFRLPNDLKEELQHITTRECINISALIRKLLEEWIKENQREPKEDKREIKEINTDSQK